MSDQTHAVSSVATADTFSPEFDAPEVKFFGQEDGHATTAIARMLVLFFFYSLIIMGCVVYVVLDSHWMDAQPANSHNTHTEVAPY